MKNNIYTAIPDWFNKVQSQSTDNTGTTITQTTIIGGGGSISMSVHNLFIKSDTTITIDDFTISDLFVTDQITDTENWLTTPLLHTLPNTEVSVTTAVQQLYIGAYDKNNNQIKLYQFSEAISTVVIPENCYYLRASSNKTNTDLTIKYVGLNNFDETQQNKLESSSFQNFLTLVEGDEKGVITNSVQNLSLVFQNPLYYTLDKAGNVLISIDRDALFSQFENPTDDRYVTTVANSVQDILSSKNFKEGLSINGIEIVERNGFLYIKGNLATTGGITAYTDDPDDPGSGGGLPGGGAIGDIVITGSGNALVDASLSEDHSVITFTKGWLVDAESDQSITGIKDFINGLKLSGQLIKIVDGVLFLDCSIAATGGITAYATMPGEGSSSIMDQLVVDTEYFIITEEGVLTIVPGSVGGISNIYVTGNGNALTTATLSEDGKTISFTKDKTFADDTEIKRIISEFKNEVNEQLKRFVTLDTEQEITAIKHFIEGVTIGSNKHKFYEKDGVLWLEGDIAITGGITTYATENVDVSTIMDGVVVDEITITKGDDNVLRVKDVGAGSSFDENAMWSALAASSDKQISKSHLTTALTGYATETWVSQNYATLSALKSVSTKLNDFLEGSDTDTIINKWKELEAFLSGMAETDNLAEILETKVDKSYVDSTFVTIATEQDITAIKHFKKGLTIGEANKMIYEENGVIYIDANVAVTGGVTMYAIDPVSVSTVMDGVAVDGTTITKVDGVLKVLNTGGGEAGSVAWGNITGKPSVFATNIANITDLHSSWDAVLKAQKPNWLTAVSIATISDLHANWDALLKAAPSAYVTRWPTISEVIDKQNLVIKLNGGTTEGTNQFTYNATAAKSLNITASSVGAAASSHSHNAISASLTGTNSLDMVYAKMADNDYFRLRVGGTASNAGYVEFATANDGNEPIYFRQYTGTFTTVKRTLTLLDGSGNSSFPGTVTAPTFNGNLAWSHITSKPTTLAGYGITDAPTKTGSGASGTWGINITGNAVSSSKSNTIAIDGISNLNSPNWDEYAATIQRFDANADNKPPVGDNANAVLNIPMTKHGTSGMYGYQLAFVSNREEIYARKWSNGNPTIWKRLPFVDYNTGYLRYGFSSVLSTDWFRSEGDTGWYSQTYGGGIYMTDSNYIRTLNNKAFCALRYDADQGSLGNSWNKGQGAFSVRIYNDSNQTPLLLAYRNATNDTGADRLFAMELLNNGNQLNFGMGGESRLELQKGYLIMNGTFRATNDVYGNRLIYKDITSTNLSASNYFLSNQPAIKCEQDLAIVDNDTARPILRWGDAVKNVGYNTRYVIGSVRSGYDWGRIFMAVSNNDAGTSAGCTFSIYGSGYVEVTGNILSTGGITAYSSDIRAKNIIENIELNLKQISEAPTVRFKWNGWKLEDDGKTHIGGLAQYTQKVLPEAVLNTNDFLNMDYATTGYIFAVHTARHLLDYETKTDKEIRKLKNRIKYLEKQLKSLHYEEANIVDN